MRSVVFYGAFLLGVFSVLAQQTPIWKNFIMDEVSSIDKESGYVLVEINESIEKQIKSGSVKVFRKLDANHFIVKSTSLDSSIIGRKWRINNQWKLQLSETGSSQFFYIVKTNTFNSDNLTVIAEYGDVLLIKSSTEDVSSLAESDDVLSISNDVQRPNVESRVIDLNLNPNRINKIHHEFPDLDGNTELISIQENRYRENDIDLLGRNIITGEESEFLDNHADEMATTIAGAGNSFITGRGVVKSAKITSSDFFPVLPNADTYYTENNIITQNHSYGIPQDTSYQAEALAFDQSAYNNENLLHVFSSGNEGTLSSPGGIYKGVSGYSNLTGDIKMTKNSLVVGSVDTLSNEIIFSSRGPTYDGRVKPEIVTYSMVGSSNSAALASGVAALLQQEYRSSIGGDMPSALVKALLINSAEDAGTEGLDFVTGYGNMNAYKTMMALKNDQYFTGLVGDGEIVGFTLDLPSDAVNLKVTLCWTDPPANVGDAIALVNNLDLRLNDASTTILPWVLNASPNALSFLATRGIDNLNNVEQVTIENPLSSYSIEVVGSEVIGLQRFYVAFEYEIENSFKWDFPTGSDNMPYNGETGSYFRWSTTFSGTGTLEYSVNDGLDWILLDSEVDLEKGYWRWNNPPKWGGSAKARMSFGSNEFETDLFTISVPLEASVGFNCGDSLMLRWKHVANASDYTVFNLREDELVEIANTIDTFLVVNNKADLSDQRFTIRPNLFNGKSLLPAPTFDYSLQGIGCYVFSFFQTVALDTGIYLNLKLGTTYGVDEIVFQRNNVVDFVDIGSIQNPSLEDYLFLDDNPTQGYNEHRVIIHFDNGEQLILSAGASFYLTDVPIRVFPNPVNGSGVLDVITKEFENSTSQFELLDGNGKRVLQKTIQGTQDFIPLPVLIPGIYYYRLSADGSTYWGRVLVR